MYYQIPLDKYFTGNGFSYSDSPTGDFTGSGSSYPAEQLPASNSIIVINKVPFIFPSKEEGKYNNMDFNNQEISVPMDYYSKVHFLGAAENGNFIEPVYFHNQEKVTVQYLGLSDWVSEYPLYNEKVAIRCSGIISKFNGYMNRMTSTIWYQTISFQEKELKFNKISFGDNPCMHIFAITIERRAFI